MRPGADRDGYIILWTMALIMLLVVMGAWHDSL